MGLGSTAKKLSKVADTAEKLYGRVQDLREEVAATRETVDDTNERIAAIEEELEEQRALLEALADENDVDAEAVTADVAVSERSDGAAGAAAAASDDGAVDGND